MYPVGKVLSDPNLQVAFHDYLPARPSNTDTTHNSVYDQTYQRRERVSRAGSTERTSSRVRSVCRLPAPQRMRGYCSAARTGTSYRDDRDRVKEQIARFGRALRRGTYISAVPPARVGACSVGPLRAGAVVRADDRDDPAASELRPLPAPSSTAGIVNLGRTYYVTTATADHNDSQAAVAFTTADRATPADRDRTRRPSAG